MAERELFYELGDVVEVMDIGYPFLKTYPNLPKGKFSV